MTIGAVATKDLVVGGERKTDGLWKHGGILDSGSLRAVDNMTTSMKTGQGTEILFDRGGQQGYIMVVDRATAGYLPLNIYATNIVLSPQSGGQLFLPPNCVDTSQIRANAVQQLIGSYVQAISWTIPAGGAWYETPMQINATLSGAIVRVEFNFLVACPTKGGRTYWTFMQDGTPVVGSLGGVDAPEANYGCMAIGQYYWTSPPTGAHRISMALNAPAGTQLISAIYSTLYLTEQKR